MQSMGMDKDEAGSQLHISLTTSGPNRFTGMSQLGVGVGVRTKPYSMYRETGNFGSCELRVRRLALSVCGFLFEIWKGDCEGLRSGAL